MKGRRQKEILPWFKLETSIFSNRKIQHLLKEKDGDSYFRIWIQILTIAIQCDQGGLLTMGIKNGKQVGLTLENFSKITGKSSKTIKKVINKFLELNMLVIEGDIFKVKNWDKYQSVGINGKVKKNITSYCEEKKLENGKLNTKEDKNKTRENNKEEKEQSREDGENGFRTFKEI